MKSNDTGQEYVTCIFYCTVKCDHYLSVAEALKLYYTVQRKQTVTPKYTLTAKHIKNQSCNKNKHLPASVYNRAQACFSNILTKAQRQVTKIGTTADAHYNKQRLMLSTFKYFHLSSSEFQYY